MTMDLDAHRRILAWGVSVRLLTYKEYNRLIWSVAQAESQATVCAGKTAFREFGFANKIASKSAGRHDFGLNVYKCHQCGLWHVGHKKPAAPRVFKRSAIQEGGDE